jgi:hypothetical protein
MGVRSQVFEVAIALRRGGWTGSKSCCPAWRSGARLCQRSAVASTTVSASDIDRPAATPGRRSFAAGARLLRSPRHRPVPALMNNPIKSRAPRSSRCG